MATRKNIDLYKTLGLDAKAKQRRSKRIAAALWARWRAMVRELPHRYQQSYRAGMRLSVEGSHVELALKGDMMAQSIEYGFGPGGVGTQGPYDMRRTLLRSAKAKFGPRGRYLNVPMRMTTRKMRGMAGGNRAYALARQLASSSRSGAQTMLGGALPRGLTQKLRPSHATDPTHGVRRYVKKVGARAQYGSFRTISQAGKPWVHPGVKARRLVRRVARMVPSVVNEVG